MAHCNLSVFTAPFPFCLCRLQPDGVNTAFRFSLNYDATRFNAQCGSNPLNTVSLQINGALTDSVTGILFDNQLANYVVNGTTLIIDLSGFQGVAPSTNLVVNVQGQQNLANLCSVPWYGVNACPYALVGPPASNCCPSGRVSST